MGELQALFLSVGGRISRKQFWTGFLILLATGLVLSFLILPLLGMSIVGDFSRVTAAAENPDQINQLGHDSTRATGWASLILIVLFAWPQAVLLLKRRHDRNKPGFEVYPLIGLGLLIALVQALGLATTPTDIGGVVVPMPSLLVLLLDAAWAALGLYLLVLCGFLKGTEGPNRYGADPRHVGRAAAA